MPIISDVTGIIGSFNGLPGLVTLCTAVGGAIASLLRWFAQRRKKSGGGQPPASVVTGLARDALIVAILAAVLAAVLDILVGVTPARLSQPAVRDLVWGVRVTFFCVLALTVFCLAGTVGAGPEHHPARAGWRSVASLLAAFLALLASAIVSVAS